MRRTTVKVIPKFTISIIIILVSFLSFNVLFISNCSSQEEISIYVTDLDDEPINQITEGNYFKVRVYDPDSQSYTFLINVSIEFNDEEYYISDLTPNQEIALFAPEVGADRDFSIRAFKDDLVGEKTITVLNKPELIVSPQELIIDADNDFYVIVKDDKSDKPVVDATVYISNIYDQQDTTNENGIVYLHAPKNREEIRVIAQKEGYETGYVDIRINTPKTFVDYIVETEYFTFFVAFIVLIGVVAFVHFRQKKSIYERTKEITKEKQMEKYGFKDNQDNSSNKDNSILNQSSSMDAVRVKSKPDSKVEEIRISRKRKEKEVVPIESKEDKMEKIISKRTQRKNQDWFKGKDDVRYEIDKITGEIDEKGKDKWFEGIDDIREKIDEKVKKDKKKDRKED